MQFYRHSTKRYAALLKSKIVTSNVTRNMNSALLSCSFLSSSARSQALPCLKNPLGRMITLALILYFTPIPSLHAALVFSAPPREDIKKGNETYGPLVSYLSNVLGERVIYEHPSGWAEYANNMRNGRYDIVFDAPHFGAWRIKHISHVPVARLPGFLGFIVVAKKQDRRLTRLRDLLSVKVCAMASPNLGTVTFYDMLNNPLYQPRFHEVSGGFKKVYQEFQDGHCRAAILRNSYYFSLPRYERENLTIITASKPIPNQTITVSQRLFAKKDLIAKKLMSVEGKKASSNLLKRFGSTQNSLRYVSTSEIEYLDSLLSGVVWGW